MNDDHAGKKGGDTSSLHLDTIDDLIEAQTVDVAKLSTRNVGLSPQEFICDQENDKEIMLLKQRALSEEEAAEVPVCYFLRKGVLMRKWRPSDAEASHEWKVIYQIVVPSAYRQDVLCLAHKTPLAGHLGIDKTYYKVLNHFYWPALRSDIKQFCRTCHICQLVGKPNKKLPVAPLQPIPAMEEPFSRIIVDTRPHSSCGSVSQD